MATKKPRKSPNPEAVELLRRVGLIASYPVADYPATGHMTRQVAYRAINDTEMSIERARLNGKISMVEHKVVFAAFEAAYEKYRQRVALAEDKRIADARAARLADEGTHVGVPKSALFVENAVDELVRKPDLGVKASMIDTALKIAALLTPGDVRSRNLAINRVRHGQVNYEEISAEGADILIGLIESKFAGTPQRTEGNEENFTRAALAGALVDAITATTNVEKLSAMSWALDAVEKLSDREEAKLAVKAIEKLFEHK